MRVEDVLTTISPIEMQGWREHFRRYPTGDYHTHILLARLCQLVVSAVGGKTSEIYDFAPWLMTDEIKKNRHEEDQKTKQNRARETLLGMINA